MNVLLTSAGRRIALLQAFQSCARARGGMVYAGDRDALAPALHLADDGFVLPSVDADDYVPTLLQRVETHDIGLLVPTIDPELSVLAAAREAFSSAGCRVLVSDTTLLDVTADKWATVRHFSGLGVRTPPSWLRDSSTPEAWPDPAFVKPRRGSASKGAQRAPRRALPVLLDQLDDPLIQAVIDAPEITVDALFDFDGRLLHYVPRLRLRTKAGESIQGRTLSDPELAAWLEHVLGHVGDLGARGPVTLQAFLTQTDPTLSEINPRFGGGFPLAYAAGGRYPDWILDLCAGRPVPPQLGAYRAGLCMTRYYQEHFIESPSPQADTLRSTER